ncbi:cation transporter [uncultured Algibacter sp.]|uniref:cation transporter n=1 Tax=uncultured Algibacter sp. TaxID=298659 RepID=UPI002617AEFA|nr:cation transporter [uncultured Algibacter sp.]
MTEREVLEKIEIKGLKAGVFANILMAIAGWYAYSITNSEALFLDGNFSFIAALSTIVAIMIVKIKHKRTEVFPFGRYFHESFFVFFKGLLILGVTIGALFQNVIKIIDYTNGEKFQTLNPKPILYYSAVMGVICFSLAFYYKKKNKELGGMSSILNVEGKTAMIDGFLSVAVGLALFLTTLVPSDSSISFLLYIGDAMVVIILALYLLGIPVKVIKDTFVEMGGGVIQNVEVKSDILDILNSNLPDDFKLAAHYISKTGSGYFVVVYILPKTDEVSVMRLNKTRMAILNDLKLKYLNVEVEIVVGQGEQS